MPTDLDVALEAASRAREVILSAAFDGFDTRFKGAVNPVTTVDAAAEDVIIDVITSHRPDDAIVAEERGGTLAAERTWVVDPLDGTVNFIHGFPHVAVSVALCVGEAPIVGVVVDVFRGEIFQAVRTGGAGVRSSPDATADDVRPIEVSTTDVLGDALVMTGFPYDRRERPEAYTKSVARVLGAAMGIRRSGSAALDLCWVGCGRIDAYWEPWLGPWDLAAGMLVVEEAGGTVTGYGGSHPGLGADGVVVSNGRFHDQLVAVVGERP